MQGTSPPGRTRSRASLRIAALGALVCLAGPVIAEPVRVVCPAIADTSVSAAFVDGQDHRLGNVGRVRRAPLQGGRTYYLVNFDLSAARDLLVTKATLRVRRYRVLLARAAVSTVASPWVEGEGRTFAEKGAGATFQLANAADSAEERRTWAGPGSDFSDVVFGNGGSRWVAVAPRFDAESFWYEIDLPPALAQALVSDLQPGGLSLADDFGRNETLPEITTRESSSPPELILEGERVAPGPSAPPAALHVSRDELGLEWLDFLAPRALGFDVRLSDQPPADETAWAAARALPVAWLPAPGETTRRVLYLPYRRSTDRVIAVRALEAGGRWSKPTVVPLPAPVERNPELAVPALPRFELPAAPDGCFTMDEGPALSRDGRWIRSTARTWWDPCKGPIALEAGRNEFVAFQVILAGGPGRYRVQLTDWNALGQPAPRVEVYQQHYVLSRLGQDKYAPDAAVPIANGQEIALALDTVATSQPASAPATSEPEPGPAVPNVVQGIWIELYVPHATPTGVWRSRLLVLYDGAAVLDLPVELTVTAPTLPDALGFKISLTGYDVPAAASALPRDDPAAWSVLDAYHRLAHVHRATLALVPYRQDGQVYPGLAPIVRGGDGDLQLDFGAWDARFGHYLDGSAFRDLPREAVPLDHFLLPLFEGWPLALPWQRAPERARLAAKYHPATTWTERPPGRRANPPPGSYLHWPFDDDALPESARVAAQAAVRQFAEHIDQRGWNQTDYHIFLNNQPGTSSFWYLRQPEVPDDVLGMRAILDLFRGGLTDGGEAPRIRIRAELAHPGRQRDLLDGRIDVALLNQEFLDRHTHVLSQPQRYPQVWMFGTELAPEYGWQAAYRWGWTARLAGARGIVVPALGDGKAWELADARAQIYPGRTGAAEPPVASLRLKALRRVQQDSEWLDRWVAANRAAGAPEGYALAVIGQELARRTDAKVPSWAALLPLLEFPPRLDTVALEELRRALRDGVQP